MSMKKNKSEIADSFRHLLKKADEMALDKKKDEIIDKFNLDTNEKYKLEITNQINKSFTKDRLGISSIKRIPKNPFKLKNKKNSEIYLRNRKELMIKISITLNKHIHYWLQKEMPKFARIQLKKHISSLLKNLQK
jgi:hypothetical protein